MRNFTKLLMAVILLATSACVQDPTEELVPVLPDQGESGKVATLRVSLPAPATKTSLGEVTAEGKYPVYWSEGDCLAVNGKTTTSIKIDPANPASAIFELPLGITIPYNIIYPYQGDGVEVNSKNGRYPVLFATEQVYTEGTFSQGSAPMYAYSDGFDDVEMHHLATALRFSIKAKAGDDVTLKYVSVSTAEAEPISGVFDLDCQTGKLYSRSGSISTVFYTFENEADSKLSADEEKTFYIAVPYGAYQQFDVNFVATDGRVSVKTFNATGEDEIRPGKVRVFPCVEFSEDQKMHLIGTDEDMMNFAKSVAENTFAGFDGALLVSDIDMSKQDWTPIGSYTGLFEGRNHTISGLTAPLFGDNAVATISNVIVEANIVESESPVVGIITRTLASGGRIFNSFAKGSITYNNPSVAATGAYTDLNIGGLVGRVTGGTIEKARSEVKIVVNAATPASASANYYPCVGGIVGYATNATITGTTNYSSIEWEDNGITSSSKVQLYVGGTAGYIPKGCVFSDNANDGSLKVNSSAYRLHLGGVVGYINQEFGNCRNDGHIYVSGEFERGLVGGVVGSLDKEVLISNSHNTGELEFASGYYITSRTGIGGVVGYAYANSDVIGCTNSGKITFNGSTKCGGPDAKTQSTNAHASIAGVVGLDYSRTLKDCVNEESGILDIGGSIGSVMKTDTSSGLQSAIAGVSGTRNEADHTSRSMSNCTNKADLYIHFVQLGGSEVYMGGVVGCYKVYNMQNCHNEGDITCSVDYSDVSKTSVKSAYLSGVVGMAAFQNKNYKTKIENCSNSGKIEYKSAKANTINLAGFARTDDYDLDLTVTNCSNKGDIVVKEDAEADEIYVGGLLSRLGSSMASSFKMYSCSNQGSIDCEASISGTVCIGGVFAASEAASWSASQASDISNTGYVNFSGSAGDAYIGGYAGKAIGVHGVSFSASANVTCTGEVTNNAYIGGYIGRLSNVSVGGEMDVKNSSKVSFDGTANKVYLAGGIGAIEASQPITIEGVVNTENAVVTFNDNMSKKVLPTNIYLGGAVGFADLGATEETRNTSILNACENHGSVSYYGKCTDGAYIGGVVGHAKNASLNSCHNTGAIVSKGIAGGIDEFATGAAVNTRDMVVGGVVGEANYDIKECSNTGNIDYTCVANTAIHEDVTSRFDVGGVAGRVYHAPTAVQRDMEFSGLYNEGKITINGTPGNTVYPWASTGRDSSTGAWSPDAISNTSRTDYNPARRNNAGGVFGRIMEHNSTAPATVDINSSFLLSNCINKGDITAPNVGQVRVLQLGGVLADQLTLHVTVDNCHNSGNISVAGANANDAQQFGYFVFMGGIIGRNFHTIATAVTETKVTHPTLDILNCTNSGSISLDEGKNGIRNTVAGGILGEIMCGTSDFKSGTGTYRRYWEVTIKGCKNLVGGDVSYYSTCQHTSLTCTYGGGILGKGGFGHQSATGYYSAMNLQIENCENYASIQYDRNDRKTAWYNHPELCGVGGIVGHFIGAVHESIKISGIKPFECVITSCRNYGRIWGLTGYLGGIIGYARHNVIVTGTEANPTLNEGNIVIDCDKDGKPIISGIYGNRAIYAGGIIGATYEYNYGSSVLTTYGREIRVDNAINKGNVGSISYAGGIAGLYYSAEHYVENCTNLGNIYSLEGNSTTIGSIVGSPRSTSITIDSVTYPNRQVGVRNCKVGGGVLRGSATLVEVTADNFHDFIFGQKWSGGAATIVEGVPYDGCTFYSASTDSGNGSDDNSGSGSEDNSGTEANL